MSVPYVEILSDSRAWDIGYSNIDQTIVVEFRLPEAASGELEEPEALLADFLGATDDVLALETAYTIFPLGRYAPSSSGVVTYLALESIKVTQVTNADWWRAEASYKYNSNEGTGGQAPVDGEITLPYVKIGFSGGGRVDHRTQSLIRLDRVATTVNPRPLPDEDFNAICVTEDAILGADVAGGGLTLRVTAYYFPEAITLDFINTLVAMQSPTACVNDDVFLGFEAEEVLFLTWDGEGTVVDVIPITFVFDVKKNIVNQEDPGFPNLTMKGHNFLDYRYIKKLDEGAKTLLMSPSFRYIHQVHYTKDFRLFGFPIS